MPAAIATRDRLGQRATTCFTSVDKIQVWGLDGAGSHFGCASSPSRLSPRVQNLTWGVAAGAAAGASTRGACRSRHYAYWEIGLGLTNFGPSTSFGRTSVGSGEGDVWRSAQLEDGT